MPKPQGAVVLSGNLVEDATTRPGPALYGLIYPLPGSVEPDRPSVRAVGMRRSGTRGLCWREGQTMTGSGATGIEAGVSSH
jgi:hypothetical protein